MCVDTCSDTEQSKSDRNRTKSLLNTVKCSALLLRELLQNLTVFSHEKTWIGETAQTNICILLVRKQAAF